MQQSAQIVFLSGFIQMCGNPSPESTTDDHNSDQFFSCEDYQIMIDVELYIAKECVSDVECDQILIEGDLTCEANSLLVNASYDSSHFYSLYDDAIMYNCELDIPLNENCTLSQASCVEGICAWTTP